LGIRIFAFLGGALSIPLPNVLPWDKTGPDHEGFEDAVRPTKSDPIQPCFVDQERFVSCSRFLGGKIRKAKYRGAESRDRLAEQKLKNKTEE
jgi:hypothetical protein